MFSLDFLVKKNKIFVTFVLFIVLSPVILLASSHRENLPSVRVFSSTAVLRPISYTTTGITSPATSLNVTAYSSGIVEKIFVSKGDKVKEGQLIATLDSKKETLALEKAKAQLSSVEEDFNASEKLSQGGLESRINYLSKKFLYKDAVFDYHSALIDLERRNVFSPINGLVFSVPVDVFQYINIGKEIVAEVVDVSSMKVISYVPQQLFSSGLKLGGPLKISMNDGSVINSKITYLSKLSDKDTHTFKLESWLDNNEGLEVGTAVDVEILMNNVYTHKVPLYVLVSNELGDIGVNVIKKEENSDTYKMYFKEVTIELGNSENYIWLSSLDKQENIVFIGQGVYKDGTEVIAEFKDII